MQRGERQLHLGLDAASPGPGSDSKGILRRGQQRASPSFRRPIRPAPPNTPRPAPGGSMLGAAPDDPGPMGLNSRRQVTGLFDEPR